MLFLCISVRGAGLPVLASTLTSVLSLTEAIVAHEGPPVSYTFVNVHVVELLLAESVWLFLYMYLH